MSRTEEHLMDVATGRPPDPAERFRSLFDANHDIVLRYALRRTQHPADAADVVAETFMVAWRRILGVPADGLERAWLLGVARRVLANERRRGSRFARLVERVGYCVEVQPAIDAFVGGADVRAALGTLKPEDREILTLTAWEGLTPAEAAVALGVPDGTARSRLHRARLRLRNELAAVRTESEEG